MLSVLTILSLCLSVAFAFVPARSSEFHQVTRLQNDAQSANEDLRSRAEKLRREVEELEAKMKREKPSASSTASSAPAVLKKTYTTLDDSEWTLSYRFASDPPPKDDADDGNDQVRLRFYSGKVGIKLKSDGYTDITDDEQVKDITYSKFWGWDEEISNEDGLRYLLFSADVEKSADDNNPGTDRFYFQARVEQDERSKEISLADGKVTVKRDIEPPGGFWGVLSGKGILAQFRVCGDFVCRPR
mmetsp:Transcript_20234/g.58044  ORF Transcript_20234/g.58044 Transcript_20234/m.58044 type:complete len:244 (-) Transcript_20234:81-812(-)